MNITIERLQKDSDVTIGALSVDGDWHSWVLEDCVREVIGQPVASWKISGKTAIPSGTYVVDVTFSNRFQKPLPILLDVPGFSGIRIHTGNYPADTEGCLLPGFDRLLKSVGRSRPAFDALFLKIKEAKAKGEKITLEIA